MLAPNLLLCEGDDDLDVLLQLLGRHGFRRLSAREEAGAGYVLTNGKRQIVQLRRAGGYDSLRSNLRLFLHPDMERLGIVIDADSDTPRRWQSVRDLFLRLGYAVPEVPPPQAGLITCESGMPVLGAWVMPDNISSGALEHFMLGLLPPRDPLWTAAAEAVEALPTELRRFRRQDELKARLRTWLAWQEDPGVPVGLPITRGRLDAKAPGAVAFVEWVKRLLSTKPLPH
jgi:hypothetical protein